MKIAQFIELLQALPPEAEIYCCEAEGPILPSPPSKPFRFMELTFWGSSIIVGGIGFVKHFGHLEATLFAVCAWIAIERTEQAWRRRP